MRCVYICICLLVDLFLYLYLWWGVDKGDRQIISHMGGKGEEGGKKPLHMNKQWGGVISKRNDNDRKKVWTEKASWFSRTKWHWNLRSPPPSLIVEGSPNNKLECNKDPHHHIIDDSWIWLGMRMPALDHQWFSLVHCNLLGRQKKHANCSLWFLCLYFCIFMFFVFLCL